MNYEEINKSYARDSIAQAASEIGKLRGTVLITVILCLLITIISVWVMVHREYPIIIPGYSDKPVYISENDAPPSYLRMTAEYVTYLTQNYNPEDYLQKHEYALKYFSPGADSRYEKFFIDEFKNIIDKDRISASFEPQDFRIDMKNKTVNITGFLTLIKDGTEGLPQKMSVGICFSENPYGPKISGIDARIIQ